MNDENIKMERKNKIKIINLVMLLSLILYMIISICLIYNLYKLTGIENLFRYIIILFLLVSDIFIIFSFFRIKKSKKSKRRLIFIFVLVVFSVLEFIIGYTINRGLDAISSISTRKYATYGTSLIALKDGNITDIDDIDSSVKIGRISNTEDIEGYILALEIMEANGISEKQIEDYDDSISMLTDLYDGNIDLIFISSSYVSKYSYIDRFENIKDEVIVLDEFSKKMDVQGDKAYSTSTKGVSEPFSLLVMGVDSTEENLDDSSGLGDSLILITFNPTTLNATILSIPRDTYLPITCYGNKYSKITHAASGGDSCMINTIEKSFDIDIDYYVKVNFTGLVKIVDALGGIEVEVPYSFCEQDSQRRWGEYTQYVEAGLQTLDGEQALALSRNRKTSDYCSAKWNQGVRNDFVRGQNQQLVINAILNKAKSMNNLSQFYDVLDAIGSSMTTNLSDSQILSFYNVFKNVIVNSRNLQDNNDIISMQKMYLNGEDAYIVDEVMKQELYEYIPYSDSLDAIIKAMKINLGLVDEEVATTFSFSADVEYEQEVIGKTLSGDTIKYSTASNSSKYTNKYSSKTCDTNEELGADGITCVCKAGYSKDSNGDCILKEVTCPSNKELGADGVTCVCKAGYLDDDGTCLTSPYSNNSTENKDTDKDDNILNGESYDDSDDSSINSDESSDDGDEIE